MYTMTITRLGVEFCFNKLFQRENIYVDILCQGIYKKVHAVIAPPRLFLALFSPMGIYNVKKYIFSYLNRINFPNTNHRKTLHNLQLYEIKIDSKSPNSHRNRQIYIF